MIAPNLDCPLKMALWGQPAVGGLSEGSQGWVSQEMLSQENGWEEGKLCKHVKNKEGSLLGRGVCWTSGE